MRCGTSTNAGHGVWMSCVVVSRNCYPTRTRRHSSYTLIGPNCQLLTPDHPHDYLERRKTIETGLPIHIGDDCWLGGGVIVCPGVTIGNRVIVGAGSVVTHDIPDDVVVAGNPAKVIKTNKQ